MKRLEWEHKGVYPIYILGVCDSITIGIPAGDDAEAVSIARERLYNIEPGIGQRKIAVLSKVSPVIELDDEFEVKEDCRVIGISIFVQKEDEKKEKIFGVGWTPFIQVV